MSGGTNPYRGATAPPSALGARRSVYRDRAWKLLASVGAAAAIAMALGIVACFVDAAASTLKPVRALADVWIGLWGALALVMAAVAEGSRKKAFVLIDGGLESVEDDATLSIRWAEVASVTVTYAKGRSGQPLPTRPTCNVLSQSGRSVVIGPTIERFDELAAEVLQASAPALAARADTELLHGDPVDLGAVRLTREHLAVGSRQIAWGDLESIVLDNHAVWIRPSSPGSSPIVLPPGEVTNPALLIEVAALRRRGAPR